ncbi:MAG: Bug family tripartite tricarboxylate transporter substrate binding protein [Alphaproteobacteria bacterium]|jgi:tripartite-type tricarboxylate transporter receptor subunit TctC
MQRRHILLGLTGAALASPAIAQGAWPNRPLRMIVPFTPGAATDAMARLAASKLADALGVTVVVENRAGANGAVGSQAVLQSAADGYTLLGSASIHPMARYVMKRGGSVCLNSSGAFPKWFSASVRLPSGLMAAR